MKHHGPFTWIIVIALGIGLGTLFVDFVRAAAAEKAAKQIIQQMEESRQREQDERDRQARMKALRDAENARQAEIQRRKFMREQQLKAEKARKNKEDFQRRNAVTESRNKYLQELQADCNEAHERNRKSPSRENTLNADEVCSKYEAERVRMAGR